MTTACPCGSEKQYPNCCGAFIDKQHVAPTPEALMRSRYTAYTKADMDYIARTMKSPAAENFNAEETRAWSQKVEWSHLKIISASTENDKGFVEFLAYFYDNKKRFAIHERSEFHLIENQWYYVNGQDPRVRPPIPERQLSRNEKCLCGSGKKYKKCCGGIG